MLITVLVLVVVVVVPLLGGSHRVLADLRWRGVPVLAVLLGAQIVLLETSWVPVSAGPATHLATYAMAGVFVWLNRRVAGLWLLALGAAGNALVIAANGGTMPASPAALRAAGADAEEGFVNSAAASDAHLAWLGDVFAVPATWPLANVFSVGDVLIVAGAAWVAWAGSRRAGAAAEPVSPGSPLPGPGAQETGRPPAHA